MVPIAMPSAIAIRMYCVNLLDIFLTPVSSGSLKSGRFGGGRNKLAAFCTLARMFRLWKARATTSVQCSAQYMQFAASSAVNCITKEHAPRGERHERHRQSPDPAGRKAERQARARTFQDVQRRDSRAEGRRGAGALALHFARRRQPRLDAWRDLSRRGRSQHRDGW